MKEINRLSFKYRAKVDFRKNWPLYALIIIPLIYVFVFKYIPIAGNIIAFRRYIAGGNLFGESWEGLYFFKMFWKDKGFWQAFRNTFITGSLTLVFTYPAPIILALLLNEIRSTKFKKTVQTISYIPYFLSVVVLVGIIHEVTAANGVVNQIIQFFGGKQILFLSQPAWFRPVYIISRIWQGAGWGTILYLAALAGIDPTLYEAARVDGANRWKQMLHITLPGIRPTMVTLLILNVGSVMAVGFEQIFLMYHPLTYSTSDVIATYVYRIGLFGAQFSLASAIGLFESILGIFFVTTANMVSKKVSGSSLW